MKQDDQLRFLSDGSHASTLIDLMYKHARSEACSTDAVRRGRRGRDRADARHAAARRRDVLDKRMKSVALEREKIRQRERERLARGEKEKVALRQSPEAVHAAHRRAVQPDQMARPGGGAREAGAGRLSRPGALRRLPVLPHGHADRHVRWSRLFYMFVVLELDQPPMVKIGICLGRRLCRHAGAVPLPQEPASPSASSRSSARSRTRSTCC